MKNILIHIATWVVVFWATAFMCASGLINEVIELRIENKQLKDQVKQYDEFLNKQIERNNEMTAQIFKDLIGMNAENK
jgi:hypothetical protein